MSDRSGDDAAYVQVITEEPSVSHLMSCQTEVAFTTTQRRRRSQDFLWGCTFLLKKVDDFLVVALKTKAKTTK